MTSSKLRRVNSSTMSLNRFCYTFCFRSLLPCCCIILQMMSLNRFSYPLSFHCCHVVAFHPCCFYFRCCVILQTMFLNRFHCCCWFYLFRCQCYPLSSSSVMSTLNIAMNIIIVLKDEKEAVDSGGTLRGSALHYSSHDWL